MENIIIDTNVIVGFIDIRNVNHLRSKYFFNNFNGPYIIPQIIKAECLVGSNDKKKTLEIINNIASFSPTIDGDDLTDITSVESSNKIKMVDTMLIVWAKKYHAKLITFDKKLAQIADSLGLLYETKK